MEACQTQSEQVSGLERLTEVTAGGGKSQANGVSRNPQEGIALPRGSGPPYGDIKAGPSHMGYGVCGNG